MNIVSNGKTFNLKSTKNFDIGGRKKVSSFDVPDYKLESLLKKGEYQKVFEFIGNVDAPIGTFSYTALAYAVLFQKYKAIDFFLEKKANPFKPGTNGNTAFSFALKNNDIEIAMDLFVCSPKFDILKVDYEKKCNTVWPPKNKEEFVCYIGKDSVNFQNSEMKNILEYNGNDSSAIDQIFYGAKYAYDMAGCDIEEFYSN